jgi:hypothetical protein
LHELGRARARSVRPRTSSRAPHARRAPAASKAASSSRPSVAKACPGAKCCDHATKASLVATITHAFPRNCASSVHTACGDAAPSRVARRHPELARHARARVPTASFGRQKRSKRSHPPSTSAPQRLHAEDVVERSVRTAGPQLSEGDFGTTRAPRATTARRGNAENPRRAFPWRPIRAARARARNARAHAHARARIPLTRASSKDCRCSQSRCRGPRTARFEEREPAFPGAPRRFLQHVGWPRRSSARGLTLEFLPYERRPSGEPDADEPRPQEEVR